MHVVTSVGILSVDPGSPASRSPLSGRMARATATRSFAVDACCVCKLARSQLALRMQISEEPAGEGGRRSGDGLLCIVLCCLGHVHSCMWPFWLIGAQCNSHSFSPPALLNGHPGWSLLKKGRGCFLNRLGPQMLVSFWPGVDHMRKSPFPVVP